MSFGFLSKLAEPAVTEYIPVEEYFRQWATNDEMHLNAAGKLCKAIGPGEEIDYEKEPRFARIFPGQRMRRYPVFSDHLYGCEEPIHKFVRYLEHARDGLQAERQLVSFIGPVSAGKSRVATISQDLFMSQWVWILGYIMENGKVEASPCFESPLGLFNDEEHGEMCESKYKIPRTRLISPMSGWATRRYEECKQDLSRFVAVRIKPSKAKGILLATVDPDFTSVHSFIGQAYMRGDTEEYRHFGAFNRTTTGILEFAEMWNADWAPLQKFLSVTEERRYVGDGSVGILPYQGLIIAHGNEQPWVDFKDGKFSRGGKHYTGGLVDRVVDIEFPYCTRITELGRQYREYLEESGFTGLHIAPGALEVVAAFTAATRLKDPSNCSRRLDILDGRYVGEKADTAEDLRLKTNYRDGMGGVSERKVRGLLPDLAVADSAERGLDAVLVLQELRKIVIKARLPRYGEPDKGQESKLQEPTAIVDEVALERCHRIVTRAIQEACYEDWPSHVAAKFEEYVNYAAAWCDDTPYRTPTGQVIIVSDLTQILDRAEGGLSMNEGFARLMSGDKSHLDRPRPEGGVKEFRKKLVMAALRHRAKHHDTPVWSTLPEHLRAAFEQQFRPRKADMLELIDLDRERKDPKKLEEHNKFLERMVAKGYSKKQTFRVTEWYVKNGK